MVGCTTRVKRKGGLQGGWYYGVNPGVVTVGCYPQGTTTVLYCTVLYCCVTVAAPSSSYNTGLDLCAVAVL